MTRFEFTSAGRIIFGPGVFQEIGQLAHEIGRNPFLITGPRKPLLQEVLARLGKSEGEIPTFPVSTEPTVESVNRAIQMARDEGCDSVIGVGGGSIIDTAKAVSAMLSNSGELLDYLEVIGRGKNIVHRAAPTLAVPTTAGTGSEVTRNAVIHSTEQKVKVSMRSPLMLPAIALIDPELTFSVPPEVTASTGMDALSQVIEPYVSRKANRFTDEFCRDGIRAAAGHLSRAYQRGEDADAREQMAYASLMGGLALANAGLGAVHGFAGVIGGMFSAAHGAICARLLPPVMEINLKALSAREPANPALQRYQDVARMITGDERASTQMGVEWLKNLCADLHIPYLGSYGITRNDFPVLIEKASVASSMKPNPIRLTAEEMEMVLNLAL